MADKTVSPVSRKLVNPFCQAPAYRRQSVGYKMMPRVKDMKVDRDTLAAVPVIELVDLDAEIQAQKDNCGLELLKQSLATGIATPDEYYDDGKHSYDERVVPKTIHEAAKASDAISDEIGSLAKALGVDDKKRLSGDELVELLSAHIASQIKDKAAKPTDGGDE